MGKTHTVTQLLRLMRASSDLRCAGMKPICCGDRRDAELLLAAGADGLTIDDINPVWLRTPAAPFVAAQVEETNIDIDRIIIAFKALHKRVDNVFVEGVGGWLVPIQADYFVSDLAVALNLPVLVVAQNRLGCLNHTALTVQSVRDYGLDCVGVALNTLQDSVDIAVATNNDILQQILDVPILSELTEKMEILPPEWRAVVHQPE